MKFTEKNFIEILNNWANELTNVYKENQILIRFMIFVVIANFGILFLKLWAYYLTGSMALKSDALESFVNIMAGTFALFAIVYGNRPADKDHPYGHGKIEFFSSLFEGGLILLASVLIIYESIEKFFIGIELKEITKGLLINSLAGILNGILGLFLIRNGKKYTSEAIIADGYHLLSDFYTTIGVLIGLILVMISGIVYFDPIVSLIFGLWLFYTGIKIVLSSISKLMDSENSEVLNTIIKAINEINDERIITVHGSRILQSGSYYHIDIHLVVPEFYSVHEANRLVHEFEEKVIHHAKIKGEFHSHIDPCNREYCKICKIHNCPIRKEDYQNAYSITYQEAISFRK
ncbi:MAG: cation diffusion facilitator family transporter [Leptospiraceae bacterium]|nr:cation diffusion facilitator family transporter [Leptospiraceae bacterium]MDW7976607.1 cation diffusion facilitator family transporter [Leptospiraceae bacterium]